MKPENFATMILTECLRDMHTKFNNPDIHMRTRPAKASEILVLQKRVNSRYGHPFLMQKGV